MAALTPAERQTGGPVSGRRTASVGKRRCTAAGACILAVVLAACGGEPTGPDAEEGTPDVQPEPDRLAYHVQPSDSEGQTPIGPTVEVEVLDADGERITGASTTVTLSLSVDPTNGRARLAGTTTVDASAGVARFDDVSLDLPGDGYALAASASGLPPITSDPFSVHLTFAALRVDSYLSCAVTIADRAYCWGDNGHGQLGDGTSEDRHVPVPVAGDLHFRDIDPGEAHTCGATPGGEVYCWGLNLEGELGDGTTMPSHVPVRVNGPELRTVRSGEQHSCGLTGTGVAYCWGGNSGGQLGDGTTENSSVPVPVSGGLTLEVIDIGDGYTCGLATDGTAYCWGMNRFGSLGNEGTEDSSLPVPVAGPAFAALSVGGAHACGLTADGEAHCWGFNRFGALGDGTTVDRHAPVPVSGGLTFTSISADSHTCGITSSGDTYCWGDRIQDVSDTPRRVDTPDLVEISAGAAHTCGRTAAGEGYCWGSNGHGQLGDGTTEDRPAPVPVEQ